MSGTGTDRVVVQEAAARIAAVVGAVVRQALADGGAARVLVHEADTAAGTLLMEWLGRAGVDAAPLGRDNGGGPVALEAHPADKTRLLLGGPPPQAALLPLGDLWASRVAQLAGGGAASPEVEAIAGLAGGLAALDTALARWIDGREAAEDALAELPAPAVAALRTAYDAGRLHRRRAGLVPKLGGRTVGIDLFD